MRSVLQLHRRFRGRQSCNFLSLFTIFSVFETPLFAHKKDDEGLLSLCSLRHILNVSKPEPVNIYIYKYHRIPFITNHNEIRSFWLYKVGDADNLRAPHRSGASITRRKITFSSVRTTLIPLIIFVLDIASFFLNLNIKKITIKMSIN